MAHSDLPDGFLKHPVHFCALGFGSGLTPRAPGTAGTLVGLLIFFILQSLPVVWYAAIVSLVCAFGIIICAVTARSLGVNDHPAIVWDEIAGILVTLLWVPSGWVWIVLGFVLFRGFDILKPWPISLVDRRVTGGLGIMLDDLIAGIFSLICLQLIHYLL
ncbi:MAG: phosphatidylglycerophosphatase A [Gammaproteobacteria bacterium]|nr:phosphatidylglycerophosphatase A [Gammaproteobacteria bacterium]